jgi:hypothetical protein
MAISWSANLALTDVNDGSPLANVPITLVNPQGEVLATTDDSGSATFTFTIFGDQGR